jgi:CRP-like cAMP-binding protein
VGRLTGPVRATVAAVREALANDGIRRLELVWAIGIAADAALLVVLLVVVYAQDGALAAGVLGAVRMGPAVLTGMLAGTVVRRFGGRRVLLSLGLARAATAALCAIVIAAGMPSILLYGLAALGAVAGAPVRPAAATLMPGLARSPGELVAANMAWGTGEGLGTFAGPFIAGLLIAAGQLPAAAFAVAAAFLVTVIVAAGLRFEHATDAAGGTRQERGLGLAEGVRALRRRPVLRWSMLGVYGQVTPRGLLSPLLVVASLELLGMGDAGVGLLNAALGLGGFVGAVFALSAARPDRLILTQAAALAYWGAPIAVIGLLPFPAVALAAMVVTGVANAVYDVAVITIFQRGASNQERAAVFSVFEGVAGLGLVTGSLLAPVLLAAFGPSGALAIGGSVLPILSLIIYARIGRAERLSVVDEEVVRLVRAVDVFAELPLTALERLAAGMTPVRANRGEALVREGDSGETFVILASGEVEVTVGGEPMDRLGPGAGFGEIALLRRSPRTATVTALTDVTGYAVDSATFACAVSGPATAAISEQIASMHLRRGAASAGTPSPVAEGA